MDQLANILSEKITEFDIPDRFVLSPVKNPQITAYPPRNESLPAGELPSQKIPETPESHHIHQLKKTIDALKTELDALLHIFQHEFHVPLSRNNLGPVPLAAPGTVLEGVFNGYQMIAANGACYPIPPNYASKSKLVEGDLMKLTITRNGGLMYKQIQPIERTRISGILTKDSSTNDWMVGAEQKIYRVLTASVTFYKGQTGDTAGILVPLDGQSDWAAVDYIVHSE